jgi:hypothetical protein
LDAEPGRTRSYWPLLTQRDRALPGCARCAFQRACKGGVLYDRLCPGFSLLAPSGVPLGVLALPGLPQLRARPAGAYYRSFPGLSSFSRLCPVSSTPGQKPVGTLLLSRRAVSKSSSLNLPTLKREPRSGWRRYGRRPRGCRPGGSRLGGRAGPGDVQATEGVLEELGDVLLNVPGGLERRACGRCARARR